MAGASPFTAAIVPTPSRPIRSAAWRIAWDPKAKINRPVKLTVVTADRSGILAIVGETFHMQGINITEATCRAGDNGRATNSFTFLCADLAQLKEVVRNLQRIDGVVDVERG